MTTQSKNPFDQLFGIAQAISREVIHMTDDEILDEAKLDPSIKDDGLMAKNAYLKALRTVSNEEVRQVDQKRASFNLSGTLIKGMDVNVVRQKIMGLAAANDPSLQLVASQVNSLSDDDALKLYQELFSIGLFKP